MAALTPAEWAYGVGWRGALPPEALARDSGSARDKVVPLLYGTRRIVPLVVYTLDAPIDHGYKLPSTAWWWRVSGFLPWTLAFCEGPVVGYGKTWSVEPEFDGMIALSAGINSSTWGIATVNAIFPGIFPWILRNGTATEVVPTSGEMTASLTSTAWVNQMVHIPAGSPYTAQLYGYYDNTANQVITVKSTMTVTDVTFKKVASAPAALQYSVSVSTNTATLTFNSADADKWVRVSYLRSSAGDTEPSYFNGTLPAYRRTATISGRMYANRTPQDLSVEVQGFFSNDTVTSYAQPSLIVEDLVENEVRGCGMAGAFTPGSWSDANNQCLAKGLLARWYISDPAPANELLEKLGEACDFALSWVDDALGMVALSEDGATGNGATYTPPASVIYTLTADDLIIDGPNDPAIELTISSPAEVFNCYPVTYWDATANDSSRDPYMPTTVEWVDQNHAATVGVVRRAPAVELPMIATATHALEISRLKAKRAIYATRTIKFKVSWRHILLAPGDLVRINISTLNASFRVTAIEEDGDGEPITVEAVEYLGTAV